MDVPVAVHRAIDGGQQWLDVWRNSRRERVPAPVLPYCYSRDALPGAVSAEPVEVRPLSTLQPEPWFRCSFSTVLGVRDASANAPPRGLADNHVAFVERVLVDEPDYFRRYANTDPLKVLYLDVEQWTDGSRFPTGRDPLVSIAWALDDAEPECALGPRPSGGAAPDDSDVILQFLYEMKRLDPDVVVGYNLGNYDLKVLLQRCALQGIDAASLGRDGPAPRAGEELHLQGRVVYDVFDSVRLDQTLAGIKNLQLKTVAAWMGFPALREDTHNMAAIAGTERLARYNKSDVDLTRKLTRVYFRNFLELADFYGAPLNVIVRATSSFHTSTLQGRVFARATPRIVSDGRNDERYPAMYDVGDEEKPFEAAIVEIYRRGLFQPLWKLDFSSMFPSVMVSLGAGSDNTTLVGTEPLGGFRVEVEGERRRYHIPDRTRNWNVVVQVEGRSAMASMVQDLIAHRLKLKKEAKQATGDDRERLQARQSALKIILNSIYGVNASRHARYGSLPVALAIVGVARQLIRRVEDHLGDAKIETDTDGVYSAAAVDPRAIQADLEEYVRAELGAESHLLLEADSYAAGYFAQKKTYLLLHADGRLEKHGGGFKGSDLCGVFDKALDRLALALLKGEGDPREVARACLTLEGCEPQDFVMRQRLGKDEYKSANALSAQVARAYQQHHRQRPEVGQQLEYVRTTYGYDVPTPRAFANLDKRYYRAMVQGLVDKLGVEAGPKQAKLLQFEATA
ncbi:MAG TPA: DNA polymerase domain-containing protein [Candidatus Thermoplasmatota archaeon]|nr:DNA polymerase domain-containing protein [Candidatus Thermoplasmatota archaeon]